MCSRLDFLPKWIHLYLEDVLWAMMIFLIIGMLFSRKNTYWVAASAILVTFSIEISQLYQAAWINEIRHTKIDGLILGFGNRQNISKNS
ncbi:ribosomal maturation YjgA family protein [Natronincola ferrireducens]|uniref:ribosomal maturation YjgA family protein n=1 Tax=Natronincola ferrireducens TaxID=393762 RepID=UPI00115FEF46